MRQTDPDSSCIDRVKIAPPHSQLLLQIYTTSKILDMHIKRGKIDALGTCQ